MPKVFAFLLDGVRFDQLSKENTPFLYDLMGKSLVIESLKKTAPFCERTEIYTGAPGVESENYAAFIPTNKKHKSIYRAPSKFATYCIDLISFRLPSLIKGWFGFLLYRVGKKVRKKLQFHYIINSVEGGFAVNDIPFNLLNKLTLSEDYFKFDEDQAFEVSSIFDVLKERGINYLNLFDDLRITNTRPSREERVLKLDRSFSENFQLYLYADSEVDAYAHVFGIANSETQNALLRLDNSCRALHIKFIESNPDGTTLFFSPHGMMDVSSTINIEENFKKIAKKMNLNIPNDISFFLDSTMIRIWGANVTCVKDELKELDQWKAKGKFLNLQDCTKAGIVKLENEVIWMANPGVCIFPDFFRRYSAPKGMHGYDPHNSNMDGFAICNGNDIQPSIIKEDYLKNIRWTIEELLGGNKDQRSWLKYEDK